MTLTKKTVVLVIVFCAFAILSGCRVQGELPTGKVRFIDANNITDINPVLIIPTYAISSGTVVGSGTGECPYMGKPQYNCLLAHPFIHTSDSLKFVLEQPLSSVIWIPPFIYVGNKTIEITGAIAIAKGYKPEDIALRYFFERPLTYKLTPIDKLQAKEVISRLSEGIRNKQCEVFWCNKYYPVLPKDRLMKCDFTQKEWKMIEKFINTAEANLP